MGATTLEGQNGGYTRKIRNTTFVIVQKQAEKAKGTLEDKLKRMIQDEMQSLHEEKRS